MDYYEIGQRIRKVRKAKRMSQEQLAEITGISTTHMSHIETGNTKLSLEVFCAISKTLDTHADELLFGTREISGEQAFKDIISLLDSCNSKELCIISDVIKAVKESMEKYSHTNEPIDKP